MKKTMSNVRESVVESISSIFTKEDVLKLIDSIEVSESSKVNFDEDFVDELMNLVESIESDVEDIEVDEDNVEFGLDGNRLYIESVDIEKSNIESNLRELKEKVEELKSMVVVS
jgi:hypothetical protein